MRFKSFSQLRQIIHSKLLRPFKPAIKNQSGQTFIEFLFLLLVLVTLSFSLVRGFNDTVGKQWRAIVKAVALPNHPDDDFEL